MSIHLLPKGGLGNQLFQFYAAKRLAEELDCEFRIWEVFLPSTKDTFRGVSRWPLEIAPLIPPSVKTLRLLNQPRQRASLLSKIASVSFSNTQIINALPFVYLLTDKNFEKTRTKLRPNHLILMSGTFAHYKDLEKRRAEIRTRFFLDLAANGTAVPTKHHMNELSQSLAIHIRLGDHLHLGLVNLDSVREFIERAIANLDLETFSEIRLFSDEPEIAIKALPKSLRNFVKFPTSETSPIDTLVRLSNHGVIIGGRSTFFWWASFLQSPGGKAIVPKNLYASTLDTVATV